MNEQELRSLVRAVIARHTEDSVRQSARPERAHRHHASHLMFRLDADPGAEGHCLIEPAVMCNHCGYCKSWGH
jgi:DNA primase catalytic subunit